MPVIEKNARLANPTAELIQCSVRLVLASRGLTLLTPPLLVELVVTRNHHALLKFIGDGGFDVPTRLVVCQLQLTETRVK